MDACLVHDDTMEDVVTQMVALATSAVGLFGVVFCFVQRRFQKVFSSFALFLLAVSVNNLPGAFAPVLEVMNLPVEHMAFGVIILASGLCFGPLLWIYVHTLTSTNERRPRWILLHFALPGLAAFLGLFVGWLPDDLRLGVLEQDPEGWPLLFILGLTLLFLLSVPQLAIYLFLMVRRLLQYRKRLKDVYASTERQELGWIIAVGVLAFAFCVAEVLLLADTIASEEQTVLSIAFSLIGFAAFVVATLWGMRQRPGLAPPEPEAPEQECLKYEKSALTTEASSRIERKLRDAMTSDRLHQNPNLSLWDLARHVGASPNYISQVLNEAIGESFYDFVNGHRIDDAKHRLAHTNETVLAITYDVGFNSRSSFYTAFKKVTGQTPSAFRKDNALATPLVKSA